MRRASDAHSEGNNDIRRIIFQLWLIWLISFDTFGICIKNSNRGQLRSSDRQALLLLEAGEDSWLKDSLVI